MSFLPYAIAAWLFVIGLWGVVSSRNLVHTVLCLTVVQSATYLVFVGVGYRWTWTLIQTCLILGGLFFVAGILGEQVAGQRAEVRELRRQLDELRGSEGAPSDRR